MFSGADGLASGRLETEGPGRPSDFLKALGPVGGSAQETLLRQELECLAHPRCGRRPPS